MRTESNMTKARRIVEENEIKLGACMLKPERERFIETVARLHEPSAMAFVKTFADAIGPLLVARDESEA